jgi:hypothetical protein
MSTPLTAEPLSTPPTLPGWIRDGLIAAGVFVACWGGTIVWWRVSARVPASPEWMLLLFGLPVGLLLAGFAGRKWGALRARHADAVPAVPTHQANAVAIPVQAQPLAILATALRSPHGASPEELAAAIADNKARPDLDRELVDDDGFPVMCARCPNARDDALREDITDWLAAHGGADPQFGDEQWRALTLASSVVAELAGRAAIEWIVRDDAVPRLQVLPLLPADWSAAQRAAAAAWLRHTAAQAEWRGEIVQAMSDDDPANSIAQLARRAAAGEAPCVTLVVAAASHVGEATVAHWASEQALFTSARPQGWMPGEGAAGLLLGGAMPAGASDGQAVAFLMPLEEARTDDASDAHRRGTGRVLAGLVERALAQADVDAGGVAMIVADTGHRARPVYELMEYAATTMRQLDGSEDVVRVGAASGACGVVPFVTALALGAHYAGARQAPVLCLANEVPGRRIAALVRPQA